MSVLDRLLELLYPTRCAFCHKLLDGGQKVCPACLRSLPYTPMAAQRQSFPHVEACVSPLYSEGNVRLSLHRYKFKSLTAYAEVYADFVAKCIDENGIICDSITWVPLSRRRLRRRGYDQARLLAEALAKRLRLPCERTLVKKKDNPPQSRTGKAAARRANVSGVYAPERGADLTGKRLMLVDDIVTTGATLSEAAGVLRAAGASAVFAATVARGKR